MLRVRREERNSFPQRAPLLQPTCRRIWRQQPPPKVRCGWMVEVGWAGRCGFFLFIDDLSFVPLCLGHRSPWWNLREKIPRLRDFKSGVGVIGRGNN